MHKPINRNVFQNAWVVPDVEQACMQWVNEWGIGPFFLSTYQNVFTDVIYRGKPGTLEMKVALAQAGAVQIELIQPLVDNCAYTDSVPLGQMGFHHMCVWSDDVEADTQYLAGLGYVAANRAKVGPVEFAYYDTRPLMGCMLEVVTQNPATVARFEQIAAAAENWDGRDPIRD